MVGGSSDCHNFLHAFVWDENTGMVDLNKVIAPGSGYQLTNAFNINDRGEILVQALPLGEQPKGGVQLGHLALLVPCDGDSCNDSSDASALAAANAVALMRTTNRSGVVRSSGAEWPTQLAKRYHMPGAGIHQH